MKKEKLKVTGSFKESKMSYFTVNYNGLEYFVEKYKYQEENNIEPSLLDCVVKEHDNGKIEIKQDLESVIKELYEVGSVYWFWIYKLKDYGYEVKDENMIMARIIDRSKKMDPNRPVLCEVMKIEGHNITLKMVENQEVVKSDTPYYNIAELSRLLSLSEEQERLFCQLVQEVADYSKVKELYESENGRWLLAFMVKFDQMIIDRANDEFVNRQSLDTLQKLALYIIERSNLLKNANEKERRVWLDKLTIINQHLEDYHAAFDLIEEGKARTYIDEQLANLKESEYLFQPDRKLRTLLCLFNSDDALMSSQTDRIFNIILEGNKEHWKSEPFRTAFVDMLELFIAENQRQYSRIGIERMIKAIAIQLLLAKPEDDINLRLNRSMFYRLLSLVRKSDSDELLDRAFECLFTKYDENLEFEWDDVADVNNLYMLVSVKKQKKDMTGKNLVYGNNKIELHVVDGNMKIVPLDNPNASKSVLSQNEADWRNVDVLLGEKTRVKLSTQKVMKRKEFWNEVQRLLEARQSDLSTSKKMLTPSVNDEVLIEITEDPDGSGWLCCEIVDGYYEGSGYINLKEIATYINYSADIEEYFRDGQGNRLVLPAIVLKRHR